MNNKQPAAMSAIEQRPPLSPEEEIALLDAIQQRRRDQRNLSVKLRSIPPQGSDDEASLPKHLRKAAFAIGLTIVSCAGVGSWPPAEASGPAAGADDWRQDIVTRQRKGGSLTFDVYVKRVIDAGNGWNSTILLEAEDPRHVKPHDNAWGITRPLAAMTTMVSVMINEASYRVVPLSVALADHPNTLIRINRKNSRGLAFRQFLLREVFPELHPHGDRQARLGYHSDGNPFYGLLPKTHYGRQRIWLPGDRNGYGKMRVLRELTPEQIKVAMVLLKSPRDGYIGQMIALTAAMPELANRGGDGAAGVISYGAGDPDPAAEVIETFNAKAVAAVKPVTGKERWVVKEQGIITQIHMLTPEQAAEHIAVLGTPIQPDGPDAATQGRVARLVAQIRAELARPPSPPVETTGDRAANQFAKLSAADQQAFGEEAMKAQAESQAALDELIAELAAGNWSPKPASITPRDRGVKQASVGDQTFYPYGNNTYGKGDDNWGGRKAFHFIVFRAASAQASEKEYYFVGWENTNLRMTSDAVGEPLPDVKEGEVRIWRHGNNSIKRLYQLPGGKFYLYEGNGDGLPPGVAKYIRTALANSPGGAGGTAQAEAARTKAAAQGYSRSGSGTHRVVEARALSAAENSHGLYTNVSSQADADRANRAAAPLSNEFESRDADTRATIESKVMAAAQREYTRVHQEMSNNGATATEAGNAAGDAAQAAGAAEFRRQVEQTRPVPPGEGGDDVAGGTID